MCADVDAALPREVNTVFATAAKQSADGDTRFFVIATTSNGAAYVYTHEASRTLLNRHTVEQIRAELDGYVLERGGVGGKRKSKLAPVLYEGALLTADSQPLSVIGARGAVVDACVALGQVLDLEELAEAGMANVDCSVEVLPPVKDTHADHKSRKHKHKRAASTGEVQAVPKRSASACDIQGAASERLHKTVVSPPAPQQVHQVAAAIMSRWLAVPAPVVAGYAQVCAAYLDL